MSTLSDMEPEDRGLIIGLLYRAGVWMSHAEDEGGDEDDSRESKALEKIISGLATNKNAPPFVREIARETLNHKKHWPVWEEHSFDILADCEKAVAVLKRTVSKSDAKGYVIAVRKVAKAVAGAHGEFGEGLPQDSVMDKIKGFLGGQHKVEDFMNVSPAEEEALQRLAVALRLGKD